MKRKSYQKTFSATILSLINTVFALLAFVLLFRTVFYLGTYIGTAIRAFQFNNFSMIQNHISDILSSAGISIPISKVSGTTSIPFTFQLTETILASVFVVILSVISPLLVIFNGIGSFNLRFRNKGYRMLRVVHIISAILIAFSMLSIVYTYVRILIDKNIREMFASIRSKNSWIILAVFIGVGLIILIVQFTILCYHKDIAQQMNYVSSDMQDQEDILEDNHLSGIAILFGIVFLIPAIVFIVLRQNQYYLAPILVIAVLLIFSMKYFCVAACNRGLKEAVRAKTRRNRR